MRTVISSVVGVAFLLFIVGCQHSLPEIASENSHLTEGNPVARNSASANTGGKLTTSAVASDKISAAANAPSIAVNFADDDPKKTNDNHKVFSGGQKIGPTEIDSSFWNSTVDADSGTLKAGKKANLTDNKGAKTTAVVEWKSSNTWRIDGEKTDTDEKKLTRSYLDDGGGGNLITVSNIPYEKYNLYVLFSPGSGAYGLHTDVTVNGTTYPDDDEPYFMITDQRIRHTGWIESDDTDAGNYIILSDLTDSTLVFGSKFLSQDDGTESRGGIAGFIIEEASATEQAPAAE